MKKIIIVLISMLYILNCTAQPRIRQRDILNLPDSLRSKYTRAQADRRYARTGQTGQGTDTLHLSQRIDLKANLTDPRMTNARPASDVPSWAKSPFKPVYTYSETGAAAAAHAHVQSAIGSLPDSLRNKYTRAQADRRYIRTGQAITDTVHLSGRIDQKVDLTDPRLTNARAASDVSAWAKTPVKPTYTYTETGSAPASHDQSISTITNLSDSLTGKFTRSQGDNRYLKLSAYTAGSNQLQADWNATSGVQSILNKPTLFTGQWADLQGKPVIPTNTNQLTNGSNYITRTGVTATAPLQYNNSTGVLSILSTAFAPYSTVSFPGFGTSSATAVAGNDPRLSDARTASDVYPWAKAVLKPTYTYTETGAAANTHAHVQTSVTALPDSLRNKYTRTQSDRRYFIKTDTEEATQYFYTKAQVMAIVDSVKQTILNQLNP